jgi:SAM-dependent methyltransferase
VSESFDGDWLALREPFDAAARSRGLAAAFADFLPEQPVILELGAGAGSLLRWLAPIIGGSQAWLLVDADPVLLERGLVSTAEWGEAQGFEARWRNGLTLLTPDGAWRIGAQVADIADLGAVDIANADGVVCSALLDLVSARWLARLGAALRSPLLACLNVDGHDAFRPPHPADAAVRSGFRRDQARDKGFGPSVGHRAEAALRRALVPLGFEVISAAADWRIPAGAVEMLQSMVRGHAGAASRWMPSARGAIAAWQAARLRQAAAGRLSLRVGHRDILALPNGVS